MMPPAQQRRFFAQMLRPACGRHGIEGVVSELQFS